MSLWELFVSMVPAIMYYTAPITIAALGGLYSERSGVVNIALEGIMLMGAMVAGVSQFYIEKIPGLEFSAAWIALGLAALVGMLYSILHAFACINLKADQTISGTAMNILAAGITVFVAQILFKQERTPTWVVGMRKGVPFFNDLPLIGGFIKNNYATIWLALFLVLFTWYLLYYTPFGLRLRSCGIYPQASASAGINVYRMRYFGVLMSGLLAGLAGGIMCLTLGTGQFTQFVIHGFGFIAIATLIFGKWHPLGVLQASLFFGFSQVLALYANQIPLLNRLPQVVYFIMPYGLTVIALIIFYGKTQAPAAAGKIYDVGQR